MRNFWPTSHMLWGYPLNYSPYIGLIYGRYTSILGYWNSQWHEMTAIEKSADRSFKDLSALLGATCCAGDGMQEALPVTNDLQLAPSRSVRRVNQEIFFPTHDLCTLGARSVRWSFDSRKFGQLFNDGWWLRILCGAEALSGAALEQETALLRVPWLPSMVLAVVQEL